MIHAFHGFLGDPSHFDFLGEGVIKHDLYRESARDILPRIDGDDTLIGYSMGARLAMELAFQSGHFRRLVIINSHPGLPEEKKRERSLWEDAVIERLKIETPESFLRYWNALPLFKHDPPLTELSAEKLEASLPLFEKMRLSKQRNYLPFLVENKNRVLWITGNKDEKYQSIAQELISPNGIPWVTLNGGHRLLSSHQDILELFKREGLL